METRNRGSGLISLSVRLYQMMLCVYPAEFRREYGQLMQQVFNDSCRRTMRADAFGLLGLWGHVLVDYCLSLIEQYTQRGAVMTKTRFIQISGWLLTGAGVLFLLAFLAGSRPVYNEYNAAAWPVDRFLNQAATPLMFLSTLFSAVGFLGLRARFQQVGNLVQAGVIAGLLGCCIVLLALVNVLLASDSELWWATLMIGITLLFLGMALFGGASLRYGLFQRWSAVPLVTGLPWIVMMLAALAYNLATKNSLTLPDPLIALFFAVIFGGLALTGYLLQANSGMAQAPA